MDNPQPMVPTDSRPPFHRAAIWSGLVMLVGLVLGFHFELDPQGFDWGGTMLWAGGAFAICWLLTLLALFFAHRHRLRILIILLPLIPILGLVGWAVVNGSQPGDVFGIGVLLPLLLSASIIPGLVLGLLVGIFSLRLNGWKIASVITLLGVVLAGYQFSIPRGDTRQQAISSGSVAECKNTARALRNDCYKQVAVSKKDIAVCDSSFTKNSGDWTSCYVAVAKAANRIEFCIGPDGDQKITCQKEIAINEKNLDACGKLPETSGREGTLTYRQDCFQRVFNQLPVPTSTSSSAEKENWCRGPKTYPILVTGSSESLLAPYDMYCR